MQAFCQTPQHRCCCRRLCKCTVWCACFDAESNCYLCSVSNNYFECNGQCAVCYAPAANGAKLCVAAPTFEGASNLSKVPFQLPLAVVLFRLGRNAAQVAQQIAADVAQDDDGEVVSFLPNFYEDLRHGTRESACLVFASNAMTTNASLLSGKPSSTVMNQDGGPCTAIPVSCVD